MKLKKNGWHRQLQTFVLGDSSGLMMKNFCPYFWLTMFCLFVSPIVFTWKKIIDPTLTFIEDRIIYPFVDWTIQDVQPLTLMRMYDQDYKDIRVKRWILKQKEKDPNFDFYAWRKKQAEEFNKWLDEQWEQRRQKERAAERRNMKLAHYSEKFFKVFAVIFIVLVAAGLIKLFLGLWNDYEFSFAALLTVLKFIGVTIAVLAILALLIWVIGKFFAPMIFSTLRNVGSGMKSGTSSVFGFFGTAFMATKDKYCPQVQWED